MVIFCCGFVAVAVDVVVDVIVDKRRVEFANASLR